MTYRRLHRHLLALAMFAGLPTITWAQFTTFIPPQNKAADSAKAVVVAQQRARSDSIVKVQLADMKTWVDSAAGVLPTPSAASAASDSMMSTPAADPDTAARASAASTKSASSAAARRGQKAPATASDLPLLALIGTISLAIGTVMLAGTQLGRERA
jgi:hypothetical protein